MAHQLVEGDFASRLAEVWSVSMEQSHDQDVLIALLGVCHTDVKR
jgi:hypothetical protein